jgi:hypothetical protein
MGIARDLTLSIRKSVSIDGLEKTRLLIAKVLDEYGEEENSVYNCNYCKGELSAPSSKSSLRLFRCDSCDNEVVEYRGTVRTKRRSTGRHGLRPRITIRCFDKDRKERVIECHLPYRSDPIDIEMKSGDKFSILFFRVNNEMRGIQAEIENLTVKKEVSARVSYDELIQFSESLSIGASSYLKQLPETLAPSA